MKSNKISRRARLPLAALLAVVVGLVWTSFALADAGNPILDTIDASSVDNQDGSVTITVRGQWNWMSHGSDCNFDRAATGTAIVWNDRNGRFVGTNEVQRIALSGSGNTAAATFKLTFKNAAGTTGTSPLIKSTDDAATLKSKLESMLPQTIPAGGVNVTGGPGFPAAAPWSIEFSGALAEANVNSLAATNKSSNLTVTISTFTSGIAGEPYNGWFLTDGTVTAYLGTKTASPNLPNGRTNPSDRMVHPVDIGMKAFAPNLPGVTGAVSQTFADPTSNNPADYPNWKGGCGREPMTSAATLVSFARKDGNIVTITTAGPNNVKEGDQGVQVFSMFNAGYNSPAALIDRNFVRAYDVNSTTNTFKYALLNADGSPNITGSGTQCTTTATCKGNVKQQPWGSWGYETNANTHSYSHTYLKVLPDGSSGIPEKVCVNFYDVHGGGTTATTIQKVQGASEITVDGNSDNSVQTNDFNVNFGANCAVPKPSELSTTATSATIGGTIHDTAHLLSIPAGAGGTVTFRAFGPSATATCTGPPAFGPVTVNVSGPGSYRSDGQLDANGDPTGTQFTPLAAGSYYWTAVYSGSGLILGSSSPCGATGETSVVGLASPDLTTDAGATKRLGDSPCTVPAAGKLCVNLFDRATLGGTVQGYDPTGTIEFKLYLGTGCRDSGPDMNLVATRQITSGTVTGNGSYDSATVNVDQPGTYHWVATYSGDPNNNRAANACDDANEDVKVIKPGIEIVKSVNHATVHEGDTVTYTMLITNTGDSDLTNISISDDKFPTECNRSAAAITGLITAQHSTNPTGTLLPQQSVTYDCDAVIGHDDVTNTATATGTTETGSTVTDTDDASVHVIHPAIEVVKTTSTPTPTVGETVHFTIKVTNIGDTDLTDIVITDANAPGCARALLKSSTDGTSGATVTLTPTGTTSTKSYDCELANVPMSFTGNTAKACGTDELGAPDGTTCDEDTVTVTPKKAKPTLTTDAGLDVQLSATARLFDKATLAGAYPATGALGGSITFSLYGPNDSNCANAIFTDTIGPGLPNGNSSSYESAKFAPLLAGDYRWVANYTGDANNDPTANTCGSDAGEDVTVTKASSETTTAQRFIPQDTSTITGFGTPTGKVTFRLFDEADCSGAALFTQERTLSGGSATTANTGDPATDGYTAVGDGTWYWQVSYAGDANHLPSESACGVEQFKIDNDTTN